MSCSCTNKQFLLDYLREREREREFFFARPGVIKIEGGNGTAVEVKIAAQSAVFSASMFGLVSTKRKEGIADEFNLRQIQRSYRLQCWVSA